MHASGWNTCSATRWIWEQVGVGMMGGAMWGLAAYMLRLMRRGLPLCHGPLVTSCVWPLLTDAL